MSDRRLEHCEMHELLPWLNSEQKIKKTSQISSKFDEKTSKFDEKLEKDDEIYVAFAENEVWDLLVEWSAEDDPTVMVERTLGEIFLLGWKKWENEKKMKKKFSFFWIYFCQFLEFVLFSVNI